MFDGLRYRFRLRKLQREERKLDARFQTQIDAAKETGAKEDVDRLYGDWAMESDSFEDETAELQNRYLQDQAKKHLIPIPPFRDSDPTSWEESFFTGKWRLKSTARAKLRIALHEQKRRWERSQRWLPWIGALTGLIGALTGLAAVLGAYN